MQVATVSCCCLALTSLSVHTEMSQLLQHLYIYVTNSLEYSPPGVNIESGFFAAVLTEELLEM